MCDDCQTYAHFLGSPDTLLDSNGGTEVYQTSPSQIRFEEGIAQIRAMRQGPKGLMRWYTDCCRTPFANTMANPKAPFAGIVSNMYLHNDDVDATLGPVLARTQARWGFGELPDDAHPRAPVGLILRSVRVLGTAWFKGRASPNPFFDNDGEPIAQPHYYTPAEREQVEIRAREWAAKHA